MNPNAAASGSALRPASVVVGLRTRHRPAGSDSCRARSPCHHIEDADRPAAGQVQLVRVADSAMAPRTAREDRRQRLVEARARQRRGPTPASPDDGGGSSPVGQAIRSGPFGPYTLQAATAVVHAEAGGASATGWVQTTLARGERCDYYFAYIARADVCRRLVGRWKQPQRPNGFWRWCARNLSAGYTSVGSRSVAGNGPQPTGCRHLPPD